MVAPRAPAPSGYSADYQIVLTYAGLFGWRVGSKLALIDSNKILFVGAGEEYSESKPVEGLGHSSVALTPALDVINEMCGRGGRELHSAFSEVARPASMRTLIYIHQLLRLRTGTNALQGDELTVSLLRELLDHGNDRAHRGTSRIVDRAKEILHENADNLMSLGEIAQQAGVSPVYLTQSFTRSEGIPLYKYQMKLRLNRALLALPYCKSITELALDLGFSSHSHFTTTFRSAFGVAPSKFRELTS